MNIGMIYGGNEKHIAGINRVIHECVKEIFQLDKKNHYFSIQENYMNLSTEDMYQKIKIINRGIERDAFCYINGIDLIHSYHLGYEDIKYQCKRVLTIHDVIPLIHPEWFPPASYMLFDEKIRKSVQMTDKILAVSEYTKKDAVDLYNIEPERVKVIYPGLFTSLDLDAADDGLIRDYCLGEEYILSVCTLEPRKNLRGLIQAFIDFKREHTASALKLVLAGKLGWDYEFESYFQNLGKYKGDIVLTGYVSDAVLAALYKNALAVAYVSFYEGFGLPILEAMAAGKAVICSNTSSMPEVGGDTVVYCDPYETESIADAISRLYFNEDMRLSLGEKAKKRSKLFSYKKMAEETLQVYEEVMA